MKGEFNDFGGLSTGGSTSSSGSGRSTRDYTKLPEWAANYIFAAIADHGSKLNMALFAADAPAVPDSHREAFDVPDSVETVSVEEFYPQDFDVEGVGGNLSVTYEQLANSVEAGYLSEEEFQAMDIEPGETVSWQPAGAESTPQSTMRDCLVGYHSDTIVHNFGDNCTIRVGSPARSHNQVVGAHDRFIAMRFLLSDSKNAPYNRKSAEHTVGEITTAEFEEWCDNNGFADKI